MSNPFLFGNPVSPDQFLDRRTELNRIVGRIANQGQSTAIVGEPRSGKTSILLYLSAPEKRAELYGVDGERLVFSYLDAQTLSGSFSQAQFWEYALRPLYEQVIASDPGSPLARAYGTCQENEFGAFVLERLFAQMVPTSWRLVLMLDEFDMFLHHPILNCAEFFGSLRSLASRSRGALALVIASRRAVTELTKDTQPFSRNGSPYFNILSEITLGPWPAKEVDAFLRRAGDRFTAEERRFVKQVAGGHPYLLQVAAHELWEAYNDGEENPALRRRQAWERLLNEAAPILDNTWQLWPSATRQAFTAVALAEIPKLLNQREFHVKGLIHDLRDLGPELQSLKKQGFVIEDENIPGGWRVRPQVFLWWLADELVRKVRDNTAFEEWFQEHELGFLLARGKRERLSKTLRTVGGLLKDGAKALIEAAAKGTVDAIVKGA
jgi:hypothetical protein